MKVRLAKLLHPSTSRYNASQAVNSAYSAMNSLEGTVNSANQAYQSAADKCFAASEAYGNTLSGGGNSQQIAAASANLSAADQAEA